MTPREPATTIRSAQERAYCGDNDSQDSQQILEYYHRQHGIGMLSSSPRATPDEVSRASEPVTSKSASVQQTINKPSISNPTNDASRARAGVNHHQEVQAAHDAPKSHPAISRPGPPLPAGLTCYDEHAPSTSHHIPPARIDDSADQTSEKSHVRPQIPFFRKPAQSKTAKMDISQSPTQSNEGRSYDQYRLFYERRSLESSSGTKDLRRQEHSQDDQELLDGSAPDIRESQTSLELDRRTNIEDDAGTVNFNWQFSLTNGHDHSQDVDHPSSHKPTTTEPVRSSSQPSSHVQPTFSDQPAPFIPAPETPTIAPARPFLGLGDGVPQSIMGASQLFFQTQFTSGVKKAASPTSSRPSPHVFNHNTISPNNISSPLKDRGLRTSPPAFTSPAFADPSTSPQLDDQDTIPGSPNIRLPRTRGHPEPIGEYTSIRNSSSEVDEHEDRDCGSGSDSDEEIRQRKRRAKLKQERAAKTLTSIIFPRQDSKEDDIEVPSTNRRKQAEPYKDEKQTAGEVSQETVADSQEVSKNDSEVLPEPSSPGPQAIMPAVPDSTGGNEQGYTQRELPPAPQTSNETSGSKETIPETSPPRVFNVVPLQADSTRADELISSNKLGYPPSSPPVPNSVPASAPAAMQPPRVSPILISSSQPSRRSQRSQRNTTSGALPSSAASVKQRADNDTMSSLSSLSSTPDVSSSNTPNTDVLGLEADRTTKTEFSSPAAARNLRQLKPPSSKLKTYSPVQRRSRGTADRASRSLRHSSVSTDELAISPSTSTRTADDRLRQSRSIARKSMQEVVLAPTSSAGIFLGMKFATSFQTPAQKSPVEQMITGEGGLIITEGFNELFEPSVLEADTLILKPEALGAGFTALITDVHSRKPKYMQALALGLPCLSWKWVSTCISKGCLVDWSPYLLCAGQSQVLGTIRSRVLPGAFYDATTASLETIIEQRPKMLSGSRTLLVMKKSKKEEEKRMPYVFLAQALGASLTRVGSLEEARAQMRDAETSDSAFDWVYIDCNQRDAEESLFGQPSQAGSKKRKRQNTNSAAALAGRPPKKIRTLTDELVVQSLILGRLVEEGEMEL
ncbi:hypothetical protein BX600DRAFT_512583 [Xylariales sp. PMI_506]|nr:hypothetical protein BX600DRAFT_512583 [Xylariales sp. PMI_506]